MKASIGRIVHYTLTSYNAEAINKRRADGFAHMSEHRNNSNGVMVHVGNSVNEGDVYPLVVTRVWTENSVNGTVLLDGSDTFWATSVTQGEGLGFWFEPPRV